MRTQASLNEILCEVLGSRNVYFQPPSNLKMRYPAIRYKRTGFDTLNADNKAYRRMGVYELIVISTDPDNPVVPKLLDLPYCSYVRPYQADGLYHDVLTIKY